MGNAVYHFGTGGSNLGGPGLQLRRSVRDTVGSLMVLGTFTFKSVSRRTLRFIMK